MALNYSYKHDISYINYNSKNIPWKLNTSYISQNNQAINSLLNLGSINNNLLIESSQNDIVFNTPQNKNIIVKNNMTVNNNLDVSNILTTAKIDTNADISLINILYFPSLPVNIVGDLIVNGSITSQSVLEDSSSQFFNSILTTSKFTDVSIASSDIFSSDFSYMNIFDTYIYNSIIGYDNSNNSAPAKAIFTDVSLISLTLDSSINSLNYIKFCNSANSITIETSNNFSKLAISKPLVIGPSQIVSNISNISLFNGDISCNTLYYSQLFPDVKLNKYFDISIGQVSVSGNVIPSVNNRFNIGSTNYKFNEIYSANFFGFLDGSCSLANDLIKNLDMSFNNLDIGGTITLNKQNLAQFLSGDLKTITSSISDFSNANRSLLDLSISLYSKSDLDLCLNTHITKRSLLESSFSRLTNNITNISNSVYSKSDFDLCLNRNLIRINDLSAIVSVVSSPSEIYPNLSYLNSSLVKVNSAKVSDELVFPYAITYIDDNVEDTNIKEAYSYRATTTKYTITTTTNFIATATENITYYDAPVNLRQPDNVNLTQAVMVYATGDSAVNPSRSRTWSNANASDALPAVYVTVKVATPRSVTYQINTSLLTWEQHRLNAQQVRGRYLATILSSTEQTAASAAITNYTGSGIWLGGRRKAISTNTDGSGGTKIISGLYNIHRFDISGTFTPLFTGPVEVLIVGGGGGGASNYGGGGGGGGVIHIPSVSVTANSNYSIIIGSGGASMTDGEPSKAFGAIAAGGGSGGQQDANGNTGGSGGGGGASQNRTNLGGDSGNNSLGTNSGVIYGKRGGKTTTTRTGQPIRAAGGGGAGGQALDTDTNITGDTGQTGAGSGGIGIANPILGTNYYWGGGGGGSGWQDQSGGWGGWGGGGGGGTYNGKPGGRGGANALNRGEDASFNSGAGGANTGGGGGGGSPNQVNGGGRGGSGIVIIRYIRAASVRTSAAWEWHNGDPWNYENFAINEPNTIAQTNIQMYNNSYDWDDQYGNTVQPALYMTLQLQSNTNNTYEGNTQLLTWDNHKLKAQEVINRYLATIENSNQNTSVGVVISSMSVNNIYKTISGVYIGALRTSNSTASGYGSSDWQWSNGTPWSYSNFYRQGEIQQVANPTTYTYSSYIPQQPTSVRSTPEVESPVITINTSNTKIPNIISSVNGSSVVTSRVIGALNLPASTTTGPIIDVGYPNTTDPTTLSNNNKQYTTTIRTYTTTLTYAHNGTLSVTSGTATGGNNPPTTTTNNLYRIHTFTSDGTFTPAFNGTVEVLLVGGGGGGGSWLGGGGGGGGVVYMPIVDVSADQNYSIIVGSGGSGGTDGSYGSDGTASRAFTAIAAGGGSSGAGGYGFGKSGGCGGGAAAIGTPNFDTLNQGGLSSGNSLGINSGFIYGSRGGNMATYLNGTPTRAAGGGGAGGQGLDTDPNILGEDRYSNVTGDTGQTGAGSGGVGIINNILGTTYYWGGGGGGGASITQCGGYGGFGGGGGGAGKGGGGKGGINAYNNGSGGYGINGGAGGANTGGGGGGGTYNNGQGGRGGDGIVIIRYLIEQPTGSFKISENSNNNSNYSDLSFITIPTNYSCIAITNDGMFVALGKASNVTVYIRDISGWIILGSPISINFSAYTNTDVGIKPIELTDINWRKNLQNLAINFNYFTDSATSQLILAFGDTRNVIKVYSYSGGTWSLTNGFYKVTGGSWGSDPLTSYSASVLGVSTNTNFGYFVILSQSPSVLGFSVDDKFYTYNCTTTNNTIRGSRQTLNASHNNYKNIIAFKMSSDAAKIIVSNTYYVFIYNWSATNWTSIRTINYVSSAITFTYPNTSTTRIPAGPRSLDISNISANECVFAIGFPDVLIDISANRKARGYVEYWKLTDSSLNRLATLMPRKRDFNNSSVDSDEYFFSAGGIKITNANTIIVAPNFKFHFNSTTKKYDLNQQIDTWSSHFSRQPTRLLASIQNEVENELVKISARNNNVWIGGKRVTIPINAGGKTSIDWEWTTQSLWNYQNFASGQPNNIQDLRLEFSGNGWNDLGLSNTRRAIFFNTTTDYSSKNTFTIFNNFFFHSSGFSSTYFPTTASTDASNTIIATWFSRITSSNPTNNNTINFKANGAIRYKDRVTFSDIRLKENIVDTTPKLADLLKVRVVNYNLKGSKGTKLIGVVAQELEQLFPSLVNDGVLSPQDIILGKTESYKSVKYSCFDVILIKAFQEQMAIINKLSLQLDELECKTNSLKTISQDHVILKEELDFLKSENELIQFNINEITNLMAKC